MQSIRPQHVAQLAGGVALAAIILLRRLRRWVRQLFRGGVRRVGETALLRRIVRAAGGQDDAARGHEVRPQQVEEEAVPDVVDGEGLLDAGRGVGDRAGELQAGVKDERCEGRVPFLGVLRGEGADVGEGGEVQGEVGDVLLVVEGVDRCRGRGGVGARSDQDEVVRVLAGDGEGALVAEAGGASGDEHGAGWGCHGVLWVTKCR